MVPTPPLPVISYLDHGGHRYSHSEKDICGLQLNACIGESQPSCNHLSCSSVKLHLFYCIQTLRQHSFARPATLPHAHCLGKLPTHTSNLTNFRISSPREQSESKFIVSQTILSKLPQAHTSTHSHTHLHICPPAYTRTHVRTQPSFADGYQLSDLKRGFVDRFIFFSAVAGNCAPQKPL